LKGLLHYDPPMRVFLVFMTFALVTVFASQTVLASQHHHAVKGQSPFSGAIQQKGNLHCVHKGHNQGNPCPHVHGIPTRNPVECRLKSNCGGPVSGLPLNNSSSVSSFWAELFSVQLENSDKPNVIFANFQIPERLVFDPAIPPPQHF